VAQVVDHSPRKCETLISNPCTNKESKGYSGNNSVYICIFVTTCIKGEIERNKYNLSCCVGFEKWVHGIMTWENQVILTCVDLEPGNADFS
jgi:hypothetical protein